MIDFIAPPRWHCEKHGATDAVMTVSTLVPPTEARTYCVLCLRDLLERCGLKPLTREVSDK
jgi:hypothetical protein